MEFDHTIVRLCELAGLIMGLAQHAQRPDLQEVFEISWEVLADLLSGRTWRTSQPPGGPIGPP